MFIVRSNLIDILATFETEREALDFLGDLGPAFMEADDDHPGCWDAILNDGRIISIDRKKVLVATRES
jgi:hypothetical protein